MSIKLASFLEHHLSDMRAIASVAGSILDAVPVNAQDRARIENGIEKLRTGADNIAASLERLGSRNADDDAIKAPTSSGRAPTNAQVNAAIEKALPDALAAYFAANPPKAPDTVIAPGTPGPEARTAGEDAVRDAGSDTGSQHSDGTGTGTDVMKA